MASQEMASQEMATQETAIEPVRRLPYCDVILEGLQNNDRDFLHAFGRHLHWGFWEDPETADGTVEDFACAADRLCDRLLAAASITAGHAVLDAGCGIGGTLANLNETLAAVSLHGINIDERQAARGRGRVAAPGECRAFRAWRRLPAPFCERGVRPCPGGGMHFPLPQPPAVLSAKPAVSCGAAVSSLCRISFLRPMPRR